MKWAAMADDVGQIPGLSHTLEQARVVGNLPIVNCRMTLMDP